jgi:hypothetical protein
MFLEWYMQEGQTFLKPIITGDKSYMHFFTPESKRASSDYVIKTHLDRTKTS